MKETVRLVLKEKTPKTYKDLNDSRHLGEFLEERANLMWESYDQDYSAASARVLDGPQAKQGLPGHRTR